MDQPDEHWKCERNSGNGYRITSEFGGKTTVFQGYVFKLRGRMFLDLTTTGWKEDIQPKPVPSHFLARIVQLTPTAKLSAMNYNWLKELLAKDPEAVRHLVLPTGEKPDDRRVMLTADTTELQQFVLKHRTTEGAWEANVELQSEPASSPRRWWSEKGGRTRARRRRLKFMKTKSNIAMFPLVAASLLFFGTGCETVEKYSLTYRVWDNDDWRKFSDPATNLNLALFEATNHDGVLVQYDAFSEKHSRVERHAYYLHPSQARVDAEPKLELVKPSAADGMKPIPVLPTQGALTNQPSGLPAYAVVTKNGRGFTLYRPMEPESAFDLPVYAETSGTPTRIMLTPFAVAGDTVMVAAAAAVVGFLLWVQSGAPTN